MSALCACGCVWGLCASEELCVYCRSYSVICESEHCQFSTAASKQSRTAWSWTLGNVRSLLPYTFCNEFKDEGWRTTHSVMQQTIITGINGFKGLKFLRTSTAWTAHLATCASSCLFWFPRRNRNLISGAPNLVQAVEATITFVGGQQNLDMWLVLGPV